MARHYIFSAFTVFCILALSAGCGSNDGASPDIIGGTQNSTTTASTQPDNTGGLSVMPGKTVSVSGRVLDLTYKHGLEGVVVSVMDKSVQTDEQGYYALENITVPANTYSIPVTFQKENYAMNQKMLYGIEDGKNYSIYADVKPANLVQSVDPSVENTLTAVDSNTNQKATVTIPAFSMLDENNKPVQDEVTVAITLGDPTSQDDMKIFPGTFFGTVPQSIVPVTIESIAFFSITASAQNGEEIAKFDPKYPASVNLSIPQSTQNKYENENQIEWWIYNKKTGQWDIMDANPATVGTDAASVDTVDGEKVIKAAISKPAPWNYDQRHERSYFSIQVVDEKGKPMKDFRVRSEGVTYASSYDFVTNELGMAEVIVKGSTWDTAEKVRLAVVMGNSVFYATDEDEKVKTFVTPLQLEISTLSKPIIIPETRTLFVRVRSFTYPDKLLPGVIVYSNVGIKAISDQNGKCTFSLPHSVPLEIFIPQQDKKMLVLPDKNETTTIDIYEWEK
ncbi:MAG: hypothetical protein HZA48_11990 [Planctomycetes bacterium]|nr:hypothetical protein [Planctomycetota bacterium]